MIELSRTDLQKSVFVFSSGYNSAYNLFTRLTSTPFVSTGVYGWNADIFFSSDYRCALVTGYRPYGFPVNAIVQKFDRLASDVLASPLPAHKLSEILRLQSEFFQECLTAYRAHLDAKEKGTRL